MELRIQRRTLSPVATHGLIGGKKSHPLGDGKPEIDSEYSAAIHGDPDALAGQIHHCEISPQLSLTDSTSSRGMNSPCSRGTIFVQPDHSAALAKPKPAPSQMPVSLSRCDHVKTQPPRCCILPMHHKTRDLLFLTYRLMWRHRRINLRFN